MSLELLHLRRLRDEHVSTVLYGNKQEVLGRT